MGREFSAGSFGSFARAIAVALTSIALAHCSGSNYSGTNYADNGERVSHSTGRYSVGKPYSVNGQTYVPTENPKYRAEGVASWYGPDFHGGPTANGERYDMHGISAAHPTMPLPSYARVTNLENGRSIIVRVNDRGPYHRNRVIDLSIGTAKALDFYSRGLAHVRVEYVGRAPIEGSDDTMLMATLRDNSPAPAPSKVMIAAAKPFISNLDDDKGRPARTFTLTSASTRVAASAAESVSANGAKTKSLVQSASAVDPPAEPALQPDPPGAAFAPTRNETLDLMSGRGLY